MSFSCSLCGRIILPTIKVNENKIFIHDNRYEVRGGKGNKVIERNICEECAHRMGRIYD